VNGTFGTPQTPVSDGEGTLTDQMAKDFFGQYLQLSQGGQDVTADQATQIAQNTLSEPQYTQATGAVYTQADVHISSNSDSDTVLNYFNALKQSSINRSLPGETESEMTILSNAVNNNTPDDVAKIDPIIGSYEGHIADALAMTVPADAVDLQLAYINALSNVLDNIQAMQVSFTDPVRSFAGLSQYPQHVLDLNTAMKNLTFYFISKNISVN
jgi:hypothetical protein